MSIEKQKILFITGNIGKVNEINYVLNQYPELSEKYEIRNIDIEGLEEIQSLNSMKVIEHKLLSAYNKVNSLNSEFKHLRYNDMPIPVMVEDTSLGFANYNEDCSYPGPLIKYHLKALGPEIICKHSCGFSAKGTTIIGLYDGKKITYFEGSVMGTVPEYPRGTNGFGWDNIFIPVDDNIDDLTFAEMDKSLKQKYSMRSMCAYKLAEHLLTDN
jgi:XTP/dITP diphosphohydrolase